MEKDSIFYAIPGKSYEGTNALNPKQYPSSANTKVTSGGEGGVTNALRELIKQLATCLSLPCFGFK